MNRDQFLEMFNAEEDTVILEPEYLDSAIIGITTDSRLVYSRQLLEKAFVEHDSMTEEEAVEWVDYNTIRALPYMGDKSPIILEYLITEDNEID